MVALFHERGHYCGGLLTNPWPCSGALVDSPLIPAFFMEGISTPLPLLLAPQLLTGFCLDAVLASHPQPPFLRLGCTSLLEILVLLGLFLRRAIEMLCAFPIIPLGDTYHQGKSGNTSHGRNLACTLFPDYCTVHCMHIDPISQQ